MSEEIEIKVEAEELPKAQKEILMSATRMSSYLSCKFKYYCTYVLKYPRKSNVSFKLGIAVHESLAKAGELYMAKDKLTANDIKKIKDTYRTVAAQEGIQDMSSYDDGIEMVLSRVNDFGTGKIVTIEDKFKTTTSEGVTIIGAMDKVVELSEETLLIVDYKTSKYQMTSNELKSDTQLSMYDLVASIKFPNYKRIILSLDYLRNEPVFTYRTLKERRDFAKYLLAIYQEMMKMDERKAVPTINDMCNWCDHRDVCKAYKDSVLEKSIFKKNLNEFTDEELVAEYISIKNRSRILYEYETQLKLHILQKIKSTEQDLVGVDKQIYIKQTGLTSYDPKTIYENVPRGDFLNMISVGKKQIDEYMREHPEIKPMITASAQKNYTLPFLAYKTIKK
jgi:RecB family exonuclease